MFFAPMWVLGFLGVIAVEIIKWLIPVSIVLAIVLVVAAIAYAIYSKKRTEHLQKKWTKIFDKFGTKHKKIRSDMPVGYVSFNTLDFTYDLFFDREFMYYIKFPTNSHLMYWVKDSSSDEEIIDTITKIYNNLCIYKIPKTQIRQWTYPANINGVIINGSMTFEINNSKNNYIKINEKDNIISSKAYKYFLQHIPEKRDINIAKMKSTQKLNHLRMKAKDFRTAD